MSLTLVFNRRKVMKKMKEIIRSNPIGDLSINKVHEIEGWVLPKLIPDEEAVKRYYKKITGGNIDLENPSTFCEKLNWYKLFGHNVLMSKCADKVGVRDYVKEKGYGNCLNEIYKVYSNVDEIKIDDLPERFVLKAAHGTHMQIIVKDKAEINWKHARRLMKSWLRQDIYWRGREWVYKDVPHRIIAEKYIEDKTGELRDYKFFCFNGDPKFVQVDIGRFRKHIRNYYDLNWKILPMTDYVGNDPKLKVEKPVSFNQMVKMATELSKPFQFVRVDFYEVDEKPYVGEMTFFHEGGSAMFIPDKWNKIVGDYWKLISE